MIVKKYVAAAYPGIEDIVIKDIKKITGDKARKIARGRVAFECKNIEKLLSEIKSIDYSYLFIAGFKFRSLEDIKKKAGKLDYSFIKSNFVVRCKRHGSHDFNSIDAEQIVGEAIHKKGHKVDLHSNYVILVDIDDDYCFIGLLLKDKMHKRDYRVKINKQGINACLAYSLLRIAGWDSMHSLLDPNCRDGVILIEAGLSKGKKLYGIESNKSNFISAGINAKLAKVNINLHNDNLSSMDKIIEKVDYIITYLPSESKNVSKNFANRLYNDFFKKARKIAKKKVLILVTDDSLLKPNLKDFEIKEKREITAGNKYIAYLLG